MFAERRFQPSERSPYPTHDNLLPATSSWSYGSRSLSETQHTLPQHSSSSWNANQYNGWSSATLSTSPSVSPPPYTAANSNYRHSGSGAFPHTDYPESSPRSIVSSTQPSLSSCLSSSPPYSRASQNHLSSLNSTLRFNNSLWGDGLYTIDDPETGSNSELPASSSSAAPSTRAPSISPSSLSPVKVEPEESAAADCFVMEFSSPTHAAQASSSLAPPTEVPLRATQASGPMRKMMGVFRLNPFSMHESGGQATTTWSGEDAGPLEEEPQMFEFQLDLPGCERAVSEPVRTQSPALEGGCDDDYDETSIWAKGKEPHYSTASHPSWLDNESAAPHTLPSLRPYSPHVSHSPSLSSASSRRTPLDVAALDVCTSLFIR
ncbi:hypothetical protein HYDPIDRAFT_169320 [Hydnomerulius pinastri MD-312]|uniref:Uncharacterized protein n=1 Tax=Hydnomerulius pinastri MD-312 TaxID=994086 RepID=A0A0C9WD59_9AGAM|nr:hypothetical protein HYDPIDRAFT_169320 [Hydnomerulius pinastri MD-312]